MSGAEWGVWEEANTGRAVGTGGTAGSGLRTGGSGGARVAAGWPGGGAAQTLFFYFFYEACVRTTVRKCPVTKKNLPSGALSPNLTSFIWILTGNGLLNPMEVSVWAQCAPKNCCTPDLKIDCTNKIGFVPSNHSFMIPQQCCSRRALIPCWS